MTVESVLEQLEAAIGWDHKHGIKTHCLCPWTKGRTCEYCVMERARALIINLAKQLERKGKRTEPGEPEYNH